MVQPSITTKSQSFDLVKAEIEQTIRHGEASLESFQANREHQEELQNCIDFLNQLRGIFTLVELRGGTLLCRETVLLADSLSSGSQDDDNLSLTTLSDALYVLRRYVEYYHHQRVDQPELLLPIINNVREAHKEAPLPESFFFQADLLQRSDLGDVLTLPPLEVEGAEQEAHARRMRSMYQVGLLGVLRERNPAVSKKLIGRAARGFGRLCKGSDLGRMWCLLAITADTLLDRSMGFSKARKRLLMQIEKHSRDLVYKGQDAKSEDVPDIIFQELIYILYRSGSGSADVARMLQAYGLTPAEYPEALLEAHRRRLYGPGADVLTSLSGALQDELNELKDKLDIIERGIEPDVADLVAIEVTFEQLANTLSMLDLNQLSRLSKREAEKLKAWQEEGRLPSGAELYALADSILSIENAAGQLVSRGIGTETDALADAENGLFEDSRYLKEALLVVADEARSALTLAKRAITAFVESDYDKLHLANLPVTLRSIWGGFVMLDDRGAARVLESLGATIQGQLLDQNEPPSVAVLEAIADALTSLEYYIESIGTREERNLELLKLAESSLADVGR
ncbi:MAG: chemotaxis protein [Oleiphilaceae bacterium]|nr:chemotaxis protein [Oleiphilaceae bacterium]